MYYLEVCIKYTDGRTSCVNIEPHEESDQRAYCQEGKRAGWIKDYTINTVEETY